MGQALMAIAGFAALGIVATLKNREETKRKLKLLNPLVEKAEEKEMRKRKLREAYILLAATDAATALVKKDQVRRAKKRAKKLSKELAKKTPKLIVPQRDGHHAEGDKQDR